MKLNLKTPHTDPYELLVPLGIKHGCKRFVETGTLMGYFLERIRASGVFDELHSVEVDKKLYEGCIHKFLDHKNVHVYRGSSRDMLMSMMPEEGGQTCLFWLDAHCSGGTTSQDDVGSCPLRDELSQIAGMYGPRSRHVICIDDMRDMPDERGWDYPCLSEITDILKKANPDYVVKVHNVHTGILTACPR